MVPADHGRVTNATGGYVPDDAGAEPDRIVVVCWDGRTRLWTVPLDDEAGGTILMLPADLSQPPDTTRTRITPKPEKSEHPGDE